MVKNKLSRVFHTNMARSSFRGSGASLKSTGGGSFQEPKQKKKKSESESEKHERALMAREDRSTMLGGLQISAPSAISGVFTSVPTKTKSIKNGIIVSGREFIGAVEGNGVSTFGVGKSALLAPAYFNSGVLGQLARAYQLYRWRSIIVHYIPKVATSLSGQVIMCTSDNISEPFMKPEATDILSRALVAGNGVMAPLWCPAKMKAQITGQLQYVDPSVNADINQNIDCELQVYTQTSSSQQVGYLWIEYEIELLKPMLQPHLSTIPFSSGPGLRYTLVDSAAVNAVGAPVYLTDAAGSTISGQPNGTIYRAVLDIQASASGAGTTLSNCWHIVTLSRTGTSAFTSATTPYTLVGGSTLYLAVAGTVLTVHASIESAISGLASGEFVQRTATTAAGTFVFDLQLVRQGNSNLPTVQ